MTNIMALNKQAQMSQTKNQGHYKRFLELQMPPWLVLIRALVCSNDIEKGDCDLAIRIEKFMR